MELLFITDFVDGNIDKVITSLYVVPIALFAVFIAIVVDLFFGVRKAMELGEARTSYGLRRTVRKFIEYYSMLLLAFMIDILASIVPEYNLPYITFAAAAYLVFTEFISIREKANEKDRRKQNRDMNAIMTILENRGDILKSLGQIVKKELKEDDEKPME